MKPHRFDIIEEARRASALHRVAFEGTDPESVRLPAAAIEELALRLIHVMRNRVQEVVPFPPSIGMRWFSLQLAKRLVVERYYLVPAGEESAQLAQQQVTKDQQSGIRAIPLPVTGESETPMNTLWLIDDAVVVEQEAEGSWMVTTRPADIVRARHLLRRLIDRAHGRGTAIEPGPALTAALLESAELSRSVSRMACEVGSHVDRDSCSWYHGAWQYLRLFDMVSSPTWHADFYRRELSAAIRDRGARRVLISGAADYTTLALVLHAAGDLGSELEVHVADLCQTPLIACRWYAQRTAAGPISLHQVDITELDGEFDLIVTDDFLTCFTAENSGRVLRSWFSMLRPGGAVVTTVRLHTSDRCPVSDSARVIDPIDDFELRLRKRAASWQPMVLIDLEDLFRAGRRYATWTTVHDLGNAESIVGRFRDNGFAVISVDSARVQGEMGVTECLCLSVER